jgi:dephospho-CoA kinase
MIVGIAGPIASGKSTLGRALAERFSAKFVNFGDYVRHIARTRAIDISDRRALQDLGQSLVTRDVRSFVLGAFEWVNFREGNHVVLDGVRHDTVWKEVLTFASLHREAAKLIFLEMLEDERQRRLAARGLSRDEAATQESHVSETDVQLRLRDDADLLVDALQDGPAMVAAVGRYLGIS